jgi:hypothetical protein
MFEFIICPENELPYLIFIATNFGLLINPDRGILIAAA